MVLTNTRGSPAELQYADTTPLAISASTSEPSGFFWGAGSPGHLTMSPRDEESEVVR
jgi:hypothetical protein